MFVGNLPAYEPLIKEHDGQGGHSSLAITIISRQAKRLPAAAGG
ncbi:MAG: hypothetical protein OJF51_002547 [Nitrospira sp.]|jgi:hypothetical protein|nr:MAG: hypothetical protein OJF51_002547 [Nitrospira sp.]